MRFLIDEMFSPDVARQLTESGHDAIHVRDVGLSGVADIEVFEWAVEQDRAVVTENAVDYASLVRTRAASDLPSTTVLIVLKRKVPATGRGRHVARHVAAWAEANPDPYRDTHWLG